MARKIKVLVVDDSFFMRKVISDILRSDPELDVVGEAQDGVAALEMVEQLDPDVVCLDFEMPNMNGLETLKKMMKRSPRSTVVMVSGYTKQGGEVTLKCLEEGAVDFVLKPSGSLSVDMHKVREELIVKTKIAAKISDHKVKKPTSIEKTIHKSTPKTKLKEGIVAIGSSTGGPSALEVLLSGLPAKFSAPILVAQHLPKTFTTVFAKRLNNVCSLWVKEAEDGELVKSGVVYIAPGGANMEIFREKDDVKVRLEEDKGFETPSVNKLFISTAEAFRDKTIGVILTGMGKDGLLGMEKIKEVGGRTIVQNQESSVVYGMGREASNHGLADKELHLEKIADQLQDWVE